MTRDVVNMINEALPDNATHTCRFEIRSETSDRLYIVSKSKRTGKLECSCPDWVFRKRACKHIREMREFLLEAESSRKELSPEQKALPEGS